MVWEVFYMELPKNITQIGESDKHCKIYVEDYVVSYIKQINRLSCNKDMAVALYGRRKNENEVSYLFLYGACKLDFLQRETRHLSQAQLQEIEKLRKKHFADFEFLGYRLLNGEMVEGFHVFEQGICRCTVGYAQFYEKNDAMLAYMLSARELDKEPEAVDWEKFETVKKRQDQRREEYETVKKHGTNRREAYEAVQKHRQEQTVQGEMPKKSGPLTKMRVASAAVFVLVGLAAVSILWDDQNTEALKTVVGRAMAEFTEQKLPDASPDSVGMPTVTTTPAATPNQSDVPAATVTPVPTLAPVATATPVPSSAPVATATPVPSSVPSVTATPAPTLIPVAAPVSYTVQRGDTLIRISILNYGDDSKVQEICDLNEITNPDDIKVGDKILLP
jgi:nucleoid-associated protein YgaU